MAFASYGFLDTRHFSSFLPTLKSRFPFFGRPVMTFSSLYIKVSCFFNLRELHSSQSQPSSGIALIIKCKWLVYGRSELTFLPQASHTGGRSVGHLPVNFFQDFFFIIENSTYIHIITYILTLKYRIEDKNWMHQEKIIINEYKGKRRKRKNINN